MKNCFITGILCILLGIIFLYKEDIQRLYSKLFLQKNTAITLKEKNEYYRDYNFEFVQNTENFLPENKTDLYNIYYTAINSGKESFTFYCPDKYKSCLEDIKYLANDEITLSDINNFVHPYNSFDHIETEYDTLGKVTIKVNHIYTDEHINEINTKINSLKQELIKENISQEEQIKIIHDYIINNSKYDSDRSDRNIVNYKSDIAYGPLFEGYAICGGYTDLMAIFLNELNIVNYKISSRNHVWNAVKLNNIWYNLDLTWDDPVTSDGSNYLSHNYFLISTEELLDLEKIEHSFDGNVYKELSIKTIQ